MLIFCYKKILRLSTNPMRRIKKDKLVPGPFILIKNVKRTINCEEGLGKIDFKL